MIVTIDGPAGTGKSTVARMLADRLGFDYLNTGSMYRAVALVCLERAISMDDAEAIGKVPTELTLSFRQARLWLDGRDVTGAIRDARVTEAASLVAQNALVRAALVELQRRCGENGDLVTEGRDQGTVVFPNAECKIFLTASEMVRAERRQRELAAKGELVSLEAILADQRLRDHRDKAREVGPLRPAEDAVLVDTSDLGMEDVLMKLETLARGRMR